MQILFGILGLGLVVIIHEAGHFLAARAVGIDVEVFSVGWGKKLLGITRGGTEYRISLIPLGGFVKMKGETAYQKAIEEGLDEIEPQENSFFSAAPWKRIVVAIAGPAMNLVFALVVLGIINLSGFSYSSFENRIVLADDYPRYHAISSLPSPAAEAGLQTGDKILAVNGESVENYSELRQLLASNALENVNLQVERDGTMLQRSADLILDNQTGAGILGISPYIEPIIDSPVEGESRGLQPGDRITGINGKEVENSFDVRQILDSLSVGTEQVYADISVIRDGEPVVIEHPLQHNQEQDALYLGYYYSQNTYRHAADGPFDALASGWEEIGNTLAMTLKGLGLMFRGLDPMSALSGPIRIVDMVGQVTAQGLSQGIAEGLRSFFHLLSLLSVALFFGNLLPIPVLDGGQIVVFTAEMIKRKPIKPRTFFRYQTIGAIIVFGLIAFVLFSDLLYIFAG